MSALPAPFTGARLGVRRSGRGVLVVAVLAGWVALYAVTAGRWVLPLAPQEITGVHTWLNGVRDAIDAARGSSPVFVYGIDALRVAIDGLVGLLRDVLSQPSFGRPVPVIGWLGVVALVGLVALAVGTLRTALLAMAGMLALGLQGLWQEGMDTLAFTIAAVLLCLLLGLPIGVLAGVNDRVHRVIWPLLDFLQTLPSLVYLAPAALFFLISPAAAVVVTLVYSIPPVIRYTAHSIRSVPVTALEAARSLGATRAQQLRTVLLPMARSSIILGVNQTIMAALSMVTVAALIDAPGLGRTVLDALTLLDVGAAFNGGLAIVVLAVVLDRVTTAAGARSATARRRSPRAARLRAPTLVVAAIGAGFAVYLSRTYLWAAEFPSTVRGVEVTLGDDVARLATAAADAVQRNASGVTGLIKDGTTAWVIDPIQALLTGSPWFVVCAAVLALSWVLAGPRTTGFVAVCLGLLLGTGLWQAAMATLAQTVVATVVVVALGVVLGVWMARSRRVDAWVRPLLDAAQVMPAFVYLVPFVALFATSRFTAIAAAVVYAAPVSIKVVADGVLAVPVTTVEAATAAGSTAWQQITKVQLPMARNSLVLAVNQGLCYVLAMVVIGGLVGGQALGYLVAAGFSNFSLYGKGLAAGFAIVLLGVILNQVTATAAGRGRPTPT